MDSVVCAWSSALPPLDGAAVGERLEWAALLAFLCVLRYALFPPLESMLVKFQMHR